MKYSKLTQDKTRRYIDQNRVMMDLMDAVVDGKIKAVQRVLKDWRKELADNDKYNESHADTTTTISVNDSDL